jgi:outer membrane murein-binding lipoprotein Lpp
MKTKLAALTTAALLTCLSAGGCYKSDWDKEKARADALQSDLEKTKLDLAKVNGEVQAAKDAAMRMQRGTLVTVVDGKEAGRDSIVYIPQGGYFVKSGARMRGANTISYTNGMLTDGPFALKREASPDKPWIVGNVKNNRPDGEWMWYDTSGKVVNKQTFANGKQVSVEAASTAKDGKVTWKKLDNTAANKFFNDRKIMFVNIPEFVWDNK